MQRDLQTKTLTHTLSFGGGIFLNRVLEIRLSQVPCVKNCRHDETCTRTYNDIKDCT